MPVPPADHPVWTDANPAWREGGIEPPARRFLEEEEEAGNAEWHWGGMPTYNNGGPYVPMHKRTER